MQDYLHNTNSDTEDISTKKNIKKLTNLEIIYLSNVKQMDDYHKNIC